MLGTYHLTVLYEVVKDLHFLYDSDRIYVYILENIANALDADAASLYIADAQGEILRLKSCIGPKKTMLEMVSEEVPFPFGEGLAGWCAKINQAVMVENAQTDSRFSPKWDTLTGYKTKSALCAPISNKDNVLGVIEILNKKSSTFNKNDQDLVTAIAKQSAIALENGRLYGELNDAKNLNDSIISNLTGGFIAVDKLEAVTHLNPSAEKILLLSSKNSFGKIASAALKGYPQILERLSACLRTREKEIRKDMTCERPDKLTLKIGYSTFPIEDKSKNVLGAGIIFQDLTGLAR